MRILKRVMDPTLGNLAKRVDKGLDFVRLGIRNGKDGVSILIQGMDNLHGRLGLGPLAIAEVLHGVNVGRGSGFGRIKGGPGRNGRHGPR